MPNATASTGSYVLILYGYVDPYVLRRRYATIRYTLLRSLLITLPVFRSHLRYALLMAYLT